MPQDKFSPTPPVPQRCESRLTSVSQVLDAIEEYFRTCDERKMSYTQPGLVYYLGIGDMKLLFRPDDNYQGFNNRSPESKETVRLFSSPAIQQALRLAKLRIEAQRASQLLDTDGNVQALIFDLKSSFSWQDKQAISVENPDGNLGSKAIVVMPCEPNSLTMDQWQKFYDSMLESRNERQKLFLEED